MLPADARHATRDMKSWNFVLQMFETAHPMPLGEGSAAPL
jgi:hypothetical protein